jgi:restriction endonuclease S subunit
LVKRGALENRLDPKYAVREKFNSKYPFKKFSDLLKGNPMYGANESAIEGNPQIDIRYIRITDIDEYGNLKTDSWKTAEKIDEKYLLKSDDIVFARSGATAGKALIFRKEMQKSIFAGYLIKFSIDEDKVLPDYIFYFTQTEFYQSWVNSIQRPSGQPNINSEEFKNLKIPVPTLEIQAQIVEIFNTAYAEKRQKETKAKELLASIDAYLLEQLGIVLPDKIEEKKVFYVPFSKVQGNRFDPFYHKDEFEVLDIAISNGKYGNQKLGNFLGQINYGASVKSEYVADGIPFLRISDLQRNEISITEMKYLPKSMQKDIGNAFVYKDDFLISRSGTIGIVARVSKEFDGFAYGSFMIKFTLFENAPMDKDYLSYFLNCETMERIIRRNKIGAVQGNITIPTIRNLQIPLPPFEIQTDISNHIRNIRERAKTLETEAKEVIEKAKAEVEKMILGE